jgi:hypothetical protein
MGKPHRRFGKEFGAEGSDPVNRLSKGGKACRLSVVRLKRRFCRAFTAFSRISGETQPRVRY